jgi:putative hemolysin
MDPLALSILAACLLLASLFSAMHQCLVDLSRTALEDLAEQRKAGPGVRRRIAAITADVAGHARAVALMRILFTLSMVVAAVRLVASMHDNQEQGLGGVGFIDGTIVVVGSALLVWVCNVAIAESLARDLAERLVYAFARVIRVIYLAQRPLAPIGHGMDRLVRLFTGSIEQTKVQEIEQELLDVVEEGEREGQIDEAERRMIEAVVNFKSRTVEQIMTPRNEIEAIQLTSNLGEVAAFVRKARHSRIPVYKDSLDDIVGFFYVKDLLRWLAGEGRAAPAGAGKPAGVGAGGFDLRSIIRPAMLVPETKTIRALAEEFVTKKVHVAIVADEYGGTAGIVSLEDIIEEVFGEIQDEYEKAEDEPPRIEVRPEESLAEIDARAYIADVNEALEPLGVELPESDEYDTLGGFVLSTMGRIPAQNESFTYGPGDQVIVTVLEATPTRVVRVRILVKKPESSADNGHAEPPSVMVESRTDERVGSK